MQEYDFLKKIERRKFLEILSFTGMAGLVYPSNLLSSVFPSALSRVIIVEEKTATSGNTINTGAVQSMIDAGIRSLVQNDNTGEAWKSIFPGISPTSKIAIKVNCINSSLSTHPEVALAVANSIKKMLFSGSPFPENNIIIYDRTTNELKAAKYTINTSASGIRCFATNTSGIGYSSQTYNIYGSSQKISRIVTELTDYLVNISVLKNHSGAGTTGCLKNHYGTCNDPDSLHGNYCINYISMLNQAQPIYSKQMIGICDALYGIRSGGPGGSPQFIANKILFSRDIVAVDYYSRKLLYDNGCTTTKYATHIDTAATTYNLGTNDPAKMDIVNILNPTLSIKEPGKINNASAEYILEQNYPNPFNNTTSIRFFIPKENHAELSIYDTTGKKITTLIERTLMPGNHEISWNGTDSNGNMVSSGMYLCRLNTADYKKAIIMQLIK